jgi:hypothetical protein
MQILLVQYVGVMGPVPAGPVRRTRWEAARFPSRFRPEISGRLWKSGAIVRDIVARLMRKSAAAT